MLCPRTATGGRYRYAACKVACSKLLIVVFQPGTRLVHASECKPWHLPHTEWKLRCQKSILFRSFSSNRFDPFWSDPLRHVEPESRRLCGRGRTPLLIAAEHSDVLGRLRSIGGYFGGKVQTSLLRWRVDQVSRVSAPAEAFLAGMECCCRGAASKW